MALIDFDKFLASFITTMKECSQMRTFSIPICIKKALEEQGLEYKEGEIVKSQRRVSAEAKEAGYCVSEDERIMETLIEFFKNYKTQEEIGIKTFFGIPTDDIIAWLEKQSKQETTDKVKPKFHEGDWVVDEDDNSVHQIKRVIENVTSGELSYDLVGGGYFPSTKKNYHLWTIQDAKDGDILAVDSKPFIYNGSKNEVTVGAYCGFNTKHKFSFAYNYVINQNITPATKEQRDLLFKKMKEAGYEWDAEKKELKKIDWNDRIKYNPNAPSIIEENTSWSEEDEMMLECVLDKIGDLGTGVMCKEWLKGLKQRYTWKPSKEQMDAMQMAVSYFGYSWASKEQKLLESLYKDLKKLKGE